MLSLQIYDHVYVRRSPPIDLITAPESVHDRGPDDRDLSRAASQGQGHGNVPARLKNVYAPGPDRESEWTIVLQIFGLMLGAC